jgi:hypothetical protein
MASYKVVYLSLANCEVEVYCLETAFEEVDLPFVV